MNGGLLRAATACLYGLGLAPVRAVRSITRRDPLRLRKPAPCDTYWVPKAQPVGREGYFSPGGPPGEQPRGLSRITLPVFYTLAGLASPTRRDVGQSRTSAGSREEGIPDEIYTLW